MGKTLCSQCRDPSSIPGHGTRSHMHATTESLHAPTKRSSMLQQRPSTAKKEREGRKEGRRGGREGGREEIKRAPMTHYFD